jgi:hypothetical protein
MTLDPQPVEREYGRTIAVRVKGNIMGDVGIDFQRDDDEVDGDAAFCYHPPGAAGRGEAGWCFRPDDGEAGWCFRPDDGEAGWCFRPDDGEAVFCFHPGEDAFYGPLTESDARELRHLEFVGGRADR